jgi:photosynthetic reaction center cytochrome c subunit
MNRKMTKSLATLFAFAAALSFAIAGGHAQSAPAQAPAASKPKMTQEQFKNIQVLKDLPADQLIPAMQFISASLGVECEFCHVQGAFDKDDKQPKKTAREMITMMMAINKENFKGEREVTCFTCHRGSTDPVGTPIISDAPPKPEAENAAAKTLPSSDAILDKYLQAVGGRDAVEKITSRVEKASLTTPNGQEVSIDIYAKAPDKRISMMHMKEGDSVTAFDGHQGWLSNPGRPVRPMSEQDNSVAKLDADLHFAADVKQLFSNFHVFESEKIGDREVYLVVASNEGKPPVRLYFDAQSGLLVRMIRYTESPLGRNPSQVDFADYRDADGVKIPFRWTLARPGQRFTIQVSAVKQNIPVEDSEFAMPAPAPPKTN